MNHLEEVKVFGLQTSCLILSVHHALDQIQWRDANINWSSKWIMGLDKCHDIIFMTSLLALKEYDLSVRIVLMKRTWIFWGKWTSNMFWMIKVFLLLATDDWWEIMGLQNQGSLSSGVPSTCPCLREAGELTVQCHHNNLRKDTVCMTRQQVQ